MSEDKPARQKKASVLASALLSAGISVTGAPPVAQAAGPSSYAPVRNGNIEALYKDHHASVLKAALTKFNSLPPELAHAYMLTLESGWDHWQRDRNGKQIIYTGDPKQLPAKNKICDPARDLPLVVGMPLPKISPACALGVAQVIPPTSQSSLDRYNLPYTLTDVLYNPKVNFLTGHLYFMDVRNNLQQKYPSSDSLNTLAAAAYNMGEGNLNKSFRAYGLTPGSPQFDLRAYLASIDIDETRAYVPHILAQNHFISRTSVSSDADGGWFSRRVDAMTSYQQLRAGMGDFTTYFARPRQAFRMGETYSGNSMVMVDPTQNRFRVDPTQNTFRVDPTQNEFRVNPSAIRRTPEPE